MIRNVQIALGEDEQTARIVIPPQAARSQFPRLGFFEAMDVLTPTPRSITLQKRPTAAQYRDDR